jgi:hypothetical protein
MSGARWRLVSSLVTRICTAIASYYTIQPMSADRFYVVIVFAWLWDTELELMTADTVIGACGCAGSAMALFML